MILTLCISSLALAVSIGVLIWQIISWRRSGPRLRVVRIQGIGGTARGVWFIGVQAENSGRLGTQVQTFGFQLPNGDTIQAGEDFLGQAIQLPMDLPPGGKASVTYNIAGIRRALDQSGHDGRGARPFVTTGHGRFAGKPINLGDEIDLLLRATDG
ncbi:hypothetical protein A5744_15805 [Mycobacterium sp. IS-1264]|nr:hypothetical protein A5744_15805 [Mycobacterium sp. IS-1264]